MSLPLPDPTTALWILKRLLRRPWVWAWLVFVCTAWPLLAAFSPVALSATESTNRALIYELAFVSVLVGCTLALSALEEGRGTLDVAPARARRRVEATGLVTGGLLVTVLALALPLAWTGGLDGWLLLGAGLCLFHVAALALALRRLPLSAAARIALLPALAWLLPALWIPTQGPLDGLRLAFDPSHHLREIAAIRTSGAALGGAFLPIIGLLLCVRGLERSPRATA